MNKHSVAPYQPNIKRRPQHKRSVPTHMLDKLNSVALKLVLTLSYKFIDVVQSNDSKDIPEKIVALGVILLLLCERFGIRPARVLEIAGRCMSTASDAENNWMVQFDALRTYMAKEL